MNIMEQLAGRKPEYKNIPIQLTQLGQEKIEKVAGGGTDIDVMYYIADNGPSNASEIARGIRRHPKQVERAIKRLVRIGYVRYARGREDL